MLVYLQFMLLYPTEISKLQIFSAWKFIFSVLFSFISLINGRNEVKISVMLLGL
jgi:hypothetical protein